MDNNRHFNPRNWHPTGDKSLFDTLLAEWEQETKEFKKWKKGLPKDHKMYDLLKKTKKLKKRRRELLKEADDIDTKIFDNEKKLMDCFRKESNHE